MDVLRKATLWLARASGLVFHGDRRSSDGVDITKVYDCILPNVFQIRKVRLGDIFWLNHEVRSEALILLRSTEFSGGRNNIV